MLLFFVVQTRRQCPFSLEVFQFRYICVFIRELFPLFNWFYCIPVAKINITTWRRNSFFKVIWTMSYYEMFWGKEIYSSTLYLFFESQYIVGWGLQNKQEKGIFKVLRLCFAIFIYIQVEEFVCIRYINFRILLWFFYTLKYTNQIADLLCITYIILWHVSNTVQYIGKSNHAPVIIDKINKYLLENVIYITCIYIWMKTWFMHGCRFFKIICSIVDCLKLLICDLKPWNLIHYICYVSFVQ